MFIKHFNFRKDLFAHRMSYTVIQTRNYVIYYCNHEAGREHFDIVALISFLYT